MSQEPVVDSRPREENGTEKGAPGANLVILVPPPPEPAAAAESAAAAPAPEESAAAVQAAGAPQSAEERPEREPEVSEEPVAQPAPAEAQPEARASEAEPELQASEAEPAAKVERERQTKAEAPAPPAFPSELPKRSQRPGALALLKLEKVEDDDFFKLRPEAHIDSLATSIARLGQLVPVDLRLRPPDRFQVICGFRRVAALRLLKRERILARVHTDLSDEDALQIALADLLESRPADRDQLVALRERLREQGRLSAGVSETLERAISPQDDELAPELVDGPDEEVDLDELAQDAIGRMASLNQDLALVVEFWSALEPQLREALLEQLSYSEQLVAYLRGLR
ncbi:MAG: ParB/RepB/Spo0J family partition protein [Myxococcales bacterium]